MNAKLTPVKRFIPAIPQRQMEGEGVLRMLLLAFALALPMGSMAYLQIQHTRLSYQMSEIRDQFQKQEECRRSLMLERSRYQRDEEIQTFADRTGMQPRKQAHLVPRVFTKEDQRLAKLLPPAGPLGL
jgi:uncharacterized protein HemX